MVGIVYLIGAGPGDPELITLKGIECIHQADVVIYDRLVNKALLSYARTGAELLSVGKAPGRHSISQEEINELLITKASEGKVVARLKGGDPCIFGRGGDEALALAENLIPFEFVPGVSSAHAVPAYAGIPVTKRGITSTVTFVTGHDDPAGSDIDWEALARGSGTIVILMGIRNLEAITQKLVESGFPQNAPAAVVSRGTTSDQKTVVGSVGNIARRVKENRIEPPALVIIGEVVTLIEKLSWFEEPASK